MIINYDILQCNLKALFGLFELNSEAAHCVSRMYRKPPSHITFSCSQFQISRFILCRLAPSSDPFLSVRYYERTKEQQASLGFLVEPSLQEETERQVDSKNHSNISQKEPHGSVGAIAGQRAIAQGKTEEVAAALCRYSAPEEVYTCVT